MTIKHVSILIPDECGNSLSYYVTRCLKEANPKFKINIFTSSNTISTQNSWLVFYQNSRYIDRLFFSENAIGSVDYLTDLLQFIQDEKIDIVFAASEIGFKFVSKFREELARFCTVIALPSEMALQTAFDKWDLNIFFERHEIPTPKTVLLTDSERVNKFEGSVLLKPVDGHGGKNIRKFDKVAEIKLPNNSHLVPENYIVQEYIDGYDIDCNVLCDRGKVIAHTVQQPLGTESGFSPKVEKLKFLHDPHVLELAQKIMDRFQWSGVAHLDLRYCSRSGQLYVIEINPRFWQSLIGSLVAGVNFPYLLYLSSTNVDFESVDYQDKYYAKFTRSIKDVFRGSLNYSFNDTNLKYFLTDIPATIQLYAKQFLASKHR